MMNLTHLVLGSKHYITQQFMSDKPVTHSGLTFRCSAFTLLIIDECHHTHKDGVYNKIMEHYIKRKIEGETRLPQVLGLTASPGTGGGKTLESAMNHVLQVCVCVIHSKLKLLASL